MTLDTPLTLTLSPRHGTPRRLRISTSDRPDATHELVEFEWQGCRWRVTGNEPLAHVEIDAPAEVRTRP